LSLVLSFFPSLCSFFLISLLLFFLILSR
jgi:hypothetical protein